MDALRRKNSGFTLIELLIVIAIIAVLAAIAIPTYRTYLIKARYSEIVMAASLFKVGVAQCYSKTGTLTGCSGGSNGVPANIATPGPGAVDTVTTADGVVTITPKAANGIVAADTYIITPTVSGTTLTWATSGGGVTAGYVD